MPGELLLLVGSYTQPEAHVPTACGEGIVTLALDPATGLLERRQVHQGVLNPSYLAIDTARNKVFAVSENITGEGEVWQFDLGMDGALSPVSRQASHGAATCHVAVLPNDLVCAASYFSGCLDIYPLENGTLAPTKRVFHYQGKGENPLRQETSHAHQTVTAPNNRWFYVCDLGTDRVWQHDIDAQDQPVGHPMPAGHGPRHMLFHPSQPRAWVLGELTGAVTACDWDAQTGALSVIASTPVLDNGGASAAAIRMHPSTRTLWISLRASPSLLGFRLDPNGMPGMTETIPLESGEPRDFAISPDGRWLVTANQNANDIVVIELDPSTGLPTGSPHRHFPVNTPVCVLFLAETS